MKRNYLKIALILFNIGLFSFSLAWAQENKKTQERIVRAIDVLDDLTKDAEGGIPPALFEYAEGITIIPNVIKAGLVVGGRHGKGIVMVKDEKGNWSNPGFINISGGSVGLQIGAQSADIILLFRDRGTVEKIRNSDITLGGNAAVAAGPVGREVSASTNIKFQAEVYSYARTRGLFAGISLDGSVLSVNKRSNRDFYGESKDLDEIFNSKPSKEASIRKLKKRLADMHATK